MDRIAICFSGSCTYLNGRTYNNVYTRTFYFKDYPDYATLGNAIKDFAKWFESDFWHEVDRHEARHTEVDMVTVLVEYYNYFAKEWVSILDYVAY